MNDIQQGIIVEDFEPLTDNEFYTIIAALQQLRSREESIRLSRQGRGAEDLGETELSHNALTAYEKLIVYDDRVKLRLGIRSHMLVPMSRYRMKELCHAFDREL